MVHLEKGKFYSNGKNIYLIGGNVPCIGNVWSAKLTKGGKLKKITSPYDSSIEAIYKQQGDHFKLLDEKFKFEPNDLESLIVLFSNDYYNQSDFERRQIENYAKTYVKE